MLFRSLATTVAFFSLMPAALADLDVRFVEGAPKDRFIVKNVGKCELETLSLAIDLSSARGGLIFDTSAAGAGVEVYQPFEVATGGHALVSAAAVTDGDQKIEIVLRRLAPGEEFAFTIDVDDTLIESSLGQTRVEGEEIEGALVSMASVEGGKGAISTGVFDTVGRARVGTGNCAIS
jgi:hypothetical protein